MDNLSNKISFLKGYCEGLELPSESKEGKVINLMLNVLCDMNSKIEELEDTQVDMMELVEALGEEAEGITTLLNNKQCNCSCGQVQEVSESNSETLELECPHCNHIFEIDESKLYSEGNILCPKCNEVTLSDEIEELVNSLCDGDTLINPEEIAAIENNIN